MRTHESSLVLPATKQVPTVIQQSWRAIILSWARTMLAILPTYLMTRFILLILAYFGGVLFNVPNYSPLAIPSHTLVHVWNRWDATSYLTIAKLGYVNQDYTFFFPLYPTLVRTFSTLFHQDILTTGMVLSSVLFFGTLTVLYRLVEMEFDSDTAKRTALYLSIFPTTFFFFAAYTESLFLFLTLLCFYMLRRGSWWLAGLFGALATLTRFIGLFLLVIFLCEFLRQMFPPIRQAWRDKEPLTFLRLLSGLVAGLLIPLGMGIYAYALNARFGDPLVFLHVQLHWTAGLTPPWRAPLIALKSVAGLSRFTFVVPHDIIDLTALGLFALLMILCFVGPERFARNQWTFALFGLLLLLYGLLLPGVPSAGGIPYDPLPSMERLVLSIFAGFILLARFGRRPWFHQGYLLLSLPVLAFLVLQFITGYWTV